MVSPSPVHSAGPQSQLADHGSPHQSQFADRTLDDTKSLCAEPPTTPPPATHQSQIADRTLDDTKSLCAEPPTTPPPATLIEFSSASDLTRLPFLPAQDSSPMGELVERCSDEAVSDVRAPVIIDASASSYPASSTGTSSHDLANNVLSLLHVQDSGSHQQQSGATFQTSSPKHTTQSSGYGSQSHNVVHPRGRGPSQYSHRGRRDPSRGNRHWNVRHTGFNGRNYTHTPPRGLPTPLHPFSPQLPPFTPWGLELAPSPLWPPGPVPHYIPPPHGNGNFPAVLEFELRLKIVKQVEYYFSYSNLITDEYLRRRMDEQGWVPVRIIAGFPKIKQLTDNIQIVFDALRTSAVLEILGDKVRSRFNWQGWRIPIDAPSYTVFSEPTQN